MAASDDSTTAPAPLRSQGSVIFVKLAPAHSGDDYDDHGNPDEQQQQQLLQSRAEPSAAGGDTGSAAAGAGSSGGLLATVVKFAALPAADPMRAPAPPSSGNSSPAQGESSPSASTAGGPRVGQIAPLKRPLRAPPAAPLRVLIVDDIPFNQKALHMQLKIALGAATAATTVFDFAADGEKAVQMMQKAATTSMGAYHIVWMDLQVWSTLFLGVMI